MSDDLYLRNPLECIQGIPIFSARDNYVKNYDRIAEDHIQSMIDFNLNPFMKAQQVEESDLQTKSIITEFVKPHSTILDAGCGLGDLMCNLKTFRRYGVDIAMPYLKEAKSKGLDVAMAKLEELPYVDQYFDAVVACDVLEHVFSLDLVIEQCKRVLKTGGLLIVRVPNEECLDSYLTDTQSYDHSHVRNFSLSSLRLYIEKCFGFRYCFHRHFGYFFNSFHQLKYQVPSAKDNLRKIIFDIVKENKNMEKNDSFSCVSQSLKTSIEALVDSMIFIRDTHPEIYKMIAPEIIKPLELIVVFKKV